MSRREPGNPTPTPAASGRGTKPPPDHDDGRPPVRPAGATVPLNEIAREAGIGVGTVYRRFPDLQSLVDALFTERFTLFLNLATTAAELPDPARALRHYLLAAARWRSEDRALEVVLANASVDTGPVARTRDQLGRLVDGLAERRWPPAPSARTSPAPTCTPS